MAHGKRPGTISKILAPSPPLCPGPGLTTQSREEQRGLVSERSEQSPCGFKNGDQDQLIPPVPANHYYMSCEPSPEDMEDTCSEYDNVGSDVEQDYDEVLHLNREGVVDARYYKQYCPEEGGYSKCADGDDVNENNCAADQFAPRPQHSAGTREGSQSDTKPHKTSHRLRLHCAPTAGDEAEKGVERGQENRFFFSDGDEIEEVLDGAKFIEDLEETENSVQRQASPYQDNENERIRKGGDERERVDDTRLARHPNNPGGGKKCQPSHVASKEKERQAKGRGRRGTGEDVERAVSGIKGCATNGTEQRPKMSSKDSKKGAVRSKARSGSSKENPPPPPCQSHAQSPANTQKARPHRETPPAPRPSPSSTTSRDSEPGVIKPSLAHHHTVEEQREQLEDQQRPAEKSQQVTNTNRARCGQVVKTRHVKVKADVFTRQGKTVIPEGVPEQPGGPECPEFISAEDIDTPQVNYPFVIYSHVVFAH